MNLAYSINNESIDNISSFKESYISRVIDFSLYKDCKSFVAFVNKSKCFSYILLMLEIEAGRATKNISEKIEEFESIFEKLESLVLMVKNYPNKDLKRKYMRIEEDEMEIFNFLKIRYVQICNEQFIGGLSTPYKSNPDVLKQIDSIPTNELFHLLLGAIYDGYANENADFLTPTVKKQIKKANKIAYKYFPNFTSKTDFNTANNITSKSYKRALDELAR